MKRWILLLACYWFITSCTGPLWNDSWREGSSPIDYAKLLTIAQKFVSREKQDNLEGVAMIFPFDTEKALLWWEAAKLTWKAGKSLVNHIHSRDIRVQSVVSAYLSQQIPQ